MDVSPEPEYRLFTCSYTYQGQKWGLDIYATSFEDAEARLSAIHFGTVDGVVEATIPAYPGAGVYVRAVTWLQNRLPALIGIAKRHWGR